MNTESIKFDMSALRARILEDYGTINSFAAAVNMNPRTLASRLDGSTVFFQSEILKIRSALLLNNEEVTSYFFTTGKSITRKKIELAEKFLELDEFERATLLEIMKLISGHPARREFAEKWEGKIKDLPAALQAID